MMKRGKKNERKRKRGRLGKQIKKNNTGKERKIRFGKIRFGNSKANKKKSENRIKLRMNRIKRFKYGSIIKLLPKKNS